MIMSCGKDSTPGGQGLMVLDETVVGNWEGSIPPLTVAGIINFNGVFIFVEISKTDSSFAIVARDTSRDTAKNPAIKDTSLILTGAWKLNLPQDSILLICDTGRVIDTALNILVPRDSVKGKTIPMGIKISKNASTNDIVWDVALADLLPLAPLLGMDLTGVPTGIQELMKIVLKKRSQ